MKKQIVRILSVAALVSVFLVALSCGKKSNSTGPSSDDGLAHTWNLETTPPPRFVRTNYIDLSKIYEISKFRSSFGHDYSDGSEHCRSMKHYFEPRSNVDWASIDIYAPVAGKITRLYDEWAGTQLEIESSEYPAFRFTIFHVHLSKSRAVNDIVTEGELLGTHIGSQTMSDIAVWVNSPDNQGRLTSFISVLTDTVFQEFINRGAVSREEFIIPKAVRDSLPLTCSGETFMNSDTLNNWVRFNN